MDSNGLKPERPGVTWRRRARLAVVVAAVASALAAPGAGSAATTTSLSEGMVTESTYATLGRNGGATTNRMGSTWL